MQKLLVILACSLMTASFFKINYRLGVLALLATVALAAGLWTGIWWIGISIFVGFLLFPWVEILKRYRPMRFPLAVRGTPEPMPPSALFPGATNTIRALQDEGFEKVGEGKWQWFGMVQYHLSFYHPEQRALTDVVLCEYSDALFSYIAIRSFSESGKIWRTTNFPLLPAWKFSPQIHTKSLSYRDQTFGTIWEEHLEFLEKNRLTTEQLMPANLELVEERTEAEMRAQLDDNISAGLLRLYRNGTCGYTWRGLFALWGRFVGDMFKFS